MSFIIDGFTIKSDNSRDFSGYISVEIVDDQGDIVPIKALAESMKPYLKSGGPLMLLHSNLPVGRLTKGYLTTHPQTGKPAIFVNGSIFNDGRSVFNDVWNQFLKGDISFSIGGKPLSFHTIVQDGKAARSLDDIELYEVSVVCAMDGKPHQPANAMANLRRLGHETPMNGIPILVKMVIDKMPEDVKKPEENKKEEKKEENKPFEEEDVQKAITSQIEKEAMDIMGGSTALKSLQEQIAMNKTLNATIKKLEIDVNLLKKELEVSKVEKTQIEKERTKAETTAQVWKEVFRKNASSKEAIQKIVDSGESLICESGMPPSQGKIPVIAKSMVAESDFGLVENVFKKNTADMTEAEFLKAIIAAKKYGMED